MNQASEKGKRTECWPKFGPLELFFKNLAQSVTRYHGHISCTKSEKINDPILRKLSDV